MKTYYFTFCGRHSLKNNYVTIEAPNMIEARKVMFFYYGSQWAFQYDSAEEAGVGTFNLIKVKLGTPNEVPDDY